MTRAKPHSYLRWIIQSYRGSKVHRFGAQPSTKKDTPEAFYYERTKGHFDKE